MLCVGAINHFEGKMCQLFISKRQEFLYLVRELKHRARELEIEVLLAKGLLYQGEYRMAHQTRGVEGC